MADKAPLRLVVTWFICIILTTTWATSSPNRLTFPVKELTKTLLNRYRELGPGLPVTSMDEGLEVRFSVSLQQILEADLLQGTFTCVLWYVYEWKDLALTWNKTNHNGVQSIRLSPDDIYVPDIMPYNVVPGKYDMIRTPLVVYSDGTISWVPISTLTTSCTTPDGEYTDELTCSIKFGSWTYDGNKLNLTAGSDRVDTSTYTPSLDWALLKAPIIRNVLRYECCPEPYIDITAKFHLKRN